MGMVGATRAAQKCARAVRPMEGIPYCLTCAQPADPVSQRFTIVTSNNY